MDHTVDTSSPHSGGPAATVRPPPSRLLARFAPTAHSQVVARLRQLSHVDVINVAADAVAITVWGDFDDQRRVVDELSSWPDVQAVAALFAPFAEEPGGGLPLGTAEGTP